MAESRPNCSMWNFNDVKLAGGLNELRKQNQLCDIIISIGGRVFHAHKAVLAARSSYFMTIFTSGCVENTQSEISIDGNADAFEKLLEWLYIGNLEITTDNADAIAELAGVMQLTDVNLACPDFFNKQGNSSRSSTHKFQDSLGKLWKQNLLCDIVINVGGRAFRAHKAVLAACSAYFLTMFSSGFKERFQDEVNIDGNADIFEALLKLRYTEERAMEPNTACALLEMACYMQLTDISKTCSNFISDRFRSNYGNDPSVKIPFGDVFRIAQIAKSHELPELIKTSVNYMCKNVKQIKASDDLIQQGSADFLKSFLKQQDLSSEDEETKVLWIVVKWLKHDWMVRRTYAIDLLRDVRLGFVSEKNLKKLLDDEILEIEDCKKLLEQVLSWQHSDLSKEELRRQVPHMFSTRNTITAPISYSARGVQYYCVETQSWERLSNFSDLPTSEGLFQPFKNSPDLPSLIVINETLYAVGGLDEVDDDEEEEEEYLVSRQFHRYNAELNQWIPLPQMKRGRKTPVVVYLDGFIYVFGGLEEDYYDQPDVEGFDMEKEQWKCLAPFTFDTDWRLTSAVVFQGMILVYWQEMHTDVHVIQEYRPSTNTWKGKLKILGPYNGDGEEKVTQPILFIHNDLCYRVVYMDHTSSNRLQKPSVNVLNFDAQGEYITLTVGEAVNQDCIPGNEMGAFRIQDEVFVNMNGFVYKTDLEISVDQRNDLNLKEDFKPVWSGFKEDFKPVWSDFKLWIGERKSITYFTFYKKRLTKPY